MEVLLVLFGVEDERLWSEGCWTRITELKKRVRAWNPLQSLSIPSLNVSLDEDIDD